VSCPACGAPVALQPDTEGFKCDYCHSVFFPGEEEDGVQFLLTQVDPSLSLACPVCSLPLGHAAIAKIPVLCCSECHGLLMPMNELVSLIDALRAVCEKVPAVQIPPDQDDLKRTLQCPQCHCRMETHFYAGPGNVIVDSCSDCLLIWLDRGEPSRIAHAPDENDSSTSDSSW
jgi:Zn-finger nucleic acid-binding protein